MEERRKPKYTLPSILQLESSRTQLDPRSVDSEAHFLNHYVCCSDKRFGKDWWIGVIFKISFHHWVEVSNTAFLDTEKLWVSSENARLAAQVKQIYTNTALIKSPLR